MNIFRLLQIHLELECVTFSHQGDLVHLPCPDLEPLPRVYIGRHAQGFVTLFHYNVPSTLRQEITALAPELVLREPEYVQQILERDAPCQIGWRGTRYVFQQRISPQLFSEVTRVEFTESGLFADASRIAAQPTFVILRDGEIISACESARENKNAAEASVRTTENYQRHGYTCQVVLAWAHDVQSRNKIAFYSHKIQDTASVALAKRLGVASWITEVSFV